MNIVDKIENFGFKVLEKIKLKSLAEWYKNHQEGMRYLVFGALTTVVNIVVYGIFAYLILKGMESNDIAFSLNIPIFGIKEITKDILRVNISEIVAFIAGVLFAYITNKLYVFNSKTKGIKESLREFSAFIGCRIFTEIISILLMNIAVWLYINDIIMKIVSNIIIIILNFIFSKILIFKKSL